jgi:hypothetical protein
LSCSALITKYKISILVWYVRYKERGCICFHFMIRQHINNYLPAETRTPSNVKSRCCKVCYSHWMTWYHYYDMHVIMREAYHQNWDWNLRTNIRFVIGCRCIHVQCILKIVYTFKCLCTCTLTTKMHEYYIHQWNSIKLTGTMCQSC